MLCGRRCMLRSRAVWGRSARVPVLAPPRCRAAVPWALRCAWARWAGGLLLLRQQWCRCGGAAAWQPSTPHWGVTEQTSTPSHALLPPPLSLQVKLATLQLFGSEAQCAACTAMIEDAIGNKEQKQKQRQKEYDKKKEVG